MTLLSETKPKWGAQARWRLRNPDKRRAHMAVARAIRRGELVKQPCEDCGGPNAECHHEDYSAVLSVTWLCRPCHRRRHRKPLVKVGGVK